jgi:hypothetical protein
MATHMRVAELAPAEDFTMLAVKPVAVTPLG